tara:strand:+ start:4190 stop:5113 length:924 start_codon:yes stop_codon:yes gene_type:complete
MIPEKLIDSIHYKNGYKLLRLLRNHNHNNFIIYGGKKIGKTLFVKLLLQELFKDKNIYEINNPNYIVKVNTNYYYFDSFHLLPNNETMKYINSIAQSYNHYTNNCKYLIFDNFDICNHLIQNFLKVVIEKSMITCRFIFITNKLQNIINPIKSRCTLYRMYEPYAFDKLINIYKIIKKDYPINIHKLYIDCITTPLYQLNHIYLYGVYEIKQFDIHILHHIHDIFNKPFHIQDLRKYSNYIYELNIDIQTFLGNLFTMIIEKYKNIDPSKIIQLICEYDILLKKSYRNIIYLESLFIQLYRLINGPL